MSKLLYCWRCKTELAMLDESEWEIILPHLRSAIEEVQSYRVKHGASLAEALANGYGKSALSEYFRLTGFVETNPDAIWHHRLSDFGPNCSVCDKPLRTPRAKHCAECGANAK